MKPIKPTQPKTAGERLRHWRRERDMTQAQLATALGMASVGILSMWEHDLKCPSFPSALAIERVTKGPSRIDVEAWGYDRATATRTAT